MEALNHNNKADSKSKYCFCFSKIYSHFTTLSADYGLGLQSSLQHQFSAAFQRTTTNYWLFKKVLDKFKFVSDDAAAR